MLVKEMFSSACANSSNTILATVLPGEVETHSFSHARTTAAPIGLLRLRSLLEMGKVGGDGINQRLLLAA